MNAILSSTKPLSWVLQKYFPHNFLTFSRTTSSLPPTNCDLMNISTQTFAGLRIYQNYLIFTSSLVIQGYSYSCLQANAHCVEIYFYNFPKYQNHIRTLFFKTIAWGFFLTNTKWNIENSGKIISSSHSYWEYIHTLYIHVLHVIFFHLQFFFITFLFKKRHTFLC